MIMNSSGQAFTVFRFLVEAIVAMVILVIIISALRYFEEKNFEISRKRLFEGFSSAFQSPNGDVIERPEIIFRSGDIITAGAFAKEVNMQPECISFNENSLSSVSFRDSQTAFFSNQSIIKVFYRCFKQAESFCSIACEISFGKAFESFAR